VVVIFFMWAFISFPLVLFGTVIGRNWNGVPDNPCRVKTVGVTLVTWLAVINLCFLPYALLGLTLSGVRLVTYAVLILAVTYT
jgi:hypothetical protein